MLSLILSLMALLTAPRISDLPELEAGVARVDITPPLDLKASLGGYGARMNRPAEGVHDRVWAKALVLRQGEKRFALVTADMLAIPPGFKASVLEQLGQERWQPDQVMLLASHSHTSIDLEAINPRNTFAIPQIGIYNEALFKLTRDRFAQAIREAEHAPQPCTAGTSSIILNGWSHNRRQGNTAVQPELTVTRIDGTCGPMAVLVNWTAHPTFMDAVDMLYSGDWPGQMQRTVEALVPGAMALYYNGAEGDQSPIARPDSGGNWEKAERYGREMGLQVWQLWQKTRPSKSAALVYHLDPVTLPPRKPSPDFMQTGGTEYGLTEATAQRIVETLAPENTHTVSVRIGDLVIAGVPGEMAAAAGDEVKNRLRRELGTPHVVIGGLADEWISYMLTPAEYHRGGYEASMSFYGDQLGPVMVEAAIRGAERLRP